MIIPKAPSLKETRATRATRRKAVHTNFFFSLLRLFSTPVFLRRDFHFWRLAYRQLWRLQMLTTTYMHTRATHTQVAQLTQALEAAKTPQKTYSSASATNGGGDSLLAMTGEVEQLREELQEAKDKLDDEMFAHQQTRKASNTHVLMLDEDIAKLKLAVSGAPVTAAAAAGGGSENEFAELVVKLRAEAVFALVSLRVCPSSLVLPRCLS